MNPAILFTILLALAAAVMLRLHDRTLVRILGGATLLIAAPSALLMTVLDWRAELAGAQPTVLGYTLASMGAVGTVFLAAALLTTVLRLVFPKRDSQVGAPAVKVSGTAAKKNAGSGEKVLDIKRF